MRFVYCVWLWLALCAVCIAEDVTVAKIDGKWQRAETAVVSAIVETDSKAKWIQCTANRVITVTINGVELDVLSAEPVQTLELFGDKTRSFGLVAGPGKYQVSLICSDPKSGIETQVKTVVIEGPEPEPEPDPDPDPTPGDVPFPSDGYAVLILREASEAGKLPEEQRQIFSSSDIHSFCRSNAVELSDGDPFYRVWDKSYEDYELANVPEPLRVAYGKLREQAKSYPWIGVTNGSKGYSGPLPGNVADTLELLKRYK